MYGLSSLSNRIFSNPIYIVVVHCPVGPGGPTASRLRLSTQNHTDTRSHMTNLMNSYVDFVIVKVFCEGQAGDK